MTTFTNKKIHLECDGHAKELWEKCLALHLVRAGAAINPSCALSMIAGVTHEDADEAFEEMQAHLKRAGISLAGEPPAIQTHKDVLQ